MNKLIEYIKYKFYNSFIGSLYLTYKINKDFKSFKKELKERPLNTLEYNQVKLAYQTGLNKIKQQINNSLANKDAMSYDKTLKQYGEDILELSKNDNDVKKVEILKKVYLYSGIDIKSNKDKEVMIDKRIQAYTELRRSNELRKKAREERRNRSNG